MNWSSDDHWALANRAFELMTLDEREHVLTVFADLRFPSVRDRFFESVHQAIDKREMLVAGGRLPAPTA